MKTNIIKWQIVTKWLFQGRNGVVLTVATTAAERTLGGPVFQAGHDLVLADIAVTHQKHLQQVIVIFGHYSICMCVKLLNLFVLANRNR